jgi:hypothetical protein
MAEQQLSGPIPGALNLSPDGTVTRAEPLVRLPLQDFTTLLKRDNVRADPLDSVLVIEQFERAPICYRVAGWVEDDGAMILVKVSPEVLSPE